MDPPSATPDQRSQRLLEAAIDVFGRSGFEGASTRAIAAAAGRPMSAITYSYGGKEGLYLACARHIADTIGAMIGPATLATPLDTADDAERALALVFKVMTVAMVRDESQLFARFIVREQQEPTAAFDIIYGGVMGHVLARIVRSIELLSEGRVSSTAARVRAVALMGQVMAFRLARAAVLRLTGWHDIGPDELAAIDAGVQAQLSAVIADLRRRDDS